MEYKHNILILPYHPDRISPYLPNNYIALPGGFLPEDWQTYLNNDDWTWSKGGRDMVATCVVIGTDYLGWTLTDYVIPRLASGMYHASMIGRDQPVLTKQLLLRLCGEGFADDETGDVDAPTGHVLRVFRYLLHTDDRGNVDMRIYQTEDDAREDFASLDDEFVKWSVEAD